MYFPWVKTFLDGIIKESEVMDLEEKLYREELKLADLWRRFFAFWVDSLILTFVFFLIYWNELSQYLDNYYALTQAILSVIWQFSLLDFVYEVVFLSLYGATLGKMIFQVRVISISLFDKPSFFYALVRSAVKLVGKNLFYLPFLFVFFSPFKQTLHDLLAKTIVIKNA